MLGDVSVGPCALHLPLEGSSPRAARAVRVEGQALWIDLGPSVVASDLEIGARVIVEGPWSVRVLGTVAETDGASVRIAATRAIEKDRRATPRSLGGLDVRYAVATSKSEVDAWMVRGEHPVGGAWYEPDPFMSFSASGLEFEHRAIADVGDTVLLQIALPGEMGGWRATASVVRVSEIPLEHRGAYAEGEATATHRVAVHFDRIGRAARDALIAKALEIVRVRSVP